MVTELDRLHESANCVGGDRAEQSLPGSGRDAPSADDARRFRDAFEKNASSTGKQENRAAIALSGDGLVANLFGENVDPRHVVVPHCQFAVCASAFAAVPENLMESSSVRQAELRDVIAKLVDRILVNEAGLNSGKEINFSLKDPLLSGTKVQIARNGTTLQISFTAANKAQTALIVKNQENLHGALLKHTKFNDVEISVGDGESAATYSGGSEGRSKGQYYDEEDTGDGSEWRRLAATRMGRI